MSAPKQASARPRVMWSLAGYQRSWLRADVIAGLSAGAVVLPQAMAYSTIAGLPVEIGLYTCMVPMLVYALLGGSRAMSVSTTSTVATLVGATLVSVGTAATSSDPATDVMTLVLMVGLILLVARIFHLGALVENISGTVLTGVKIGVGLTVAVSQLPKLLGVAPDPNATGFFSQIGAAVRSLDDANRATVLLSVGTIATLWLLSRYLPTVPGPLVVVAAGIVLVWLANIDEDGVALIDEVPRGIPMPGVPHLDHLAPLFAGAFAIALMVFMETVAVARGIRRPDEPQIDSDRELFAVGLASVAGAFFHALPSAGGFSQSAVNLRAGARSQVSEIVTVILAVLVALFLAPVLSDLPEATLGSMVFVATLSLVKIADLQRLWRIDPGEMWVALVTAAVGLTAGMLAAVAVGIGLTLFWVLRELNRSHVVEVQQDQDAAWQPVEAPTTEPTEVLVLRITAPLYTANVRATVQAIEDHARAASARVVVVDARALGMVSVTVLDGLHDLDQELTNAGTELWIAELPPAALAVARRTTWWGSWEHQGCVQTSVNAAIRAAGVTPTSES